METRNEKQVVKKEEAGLPSNAICLKQMLS